MIEKMIWVAGIFLLSGVFLVLYFLSERKKRLFEPAAANAGSCDRWRIGTDRNL